MTLRTHKELSEQERAEVARLMRLHLETHPARIGLLYGIHAQHVRAMWRARAECELASLQEALLALRERLPGWPYHRMPKRNLQGKFAVNASPKERRAPTT
jgi:hypothetical protein